MLDMISFASTYSDLSTETEAAAAAGGIMGLLAASMLMVGLFASIYYVLTIIARWKIFTKAGEAGWKSIIPIYNEYIEWKISWTNMTLFWACIGLAVVGSILVVMGGGSGTSSSGGSMGIMGIIGCIAIVVAAVLKLVQTYKLFQSFGKGIGWFIGYILLNSIMILVLGFGSSEYQGPQD